MKNKNLLYIIAEDILDYMCNNVRRVQRFDYVKSPDIVTLNIFCDTLTDDNFHIYISLTTHAGFINSIITCYKQGLFYLKDIAESERLDGLVKVADRKVCVNRILSRLQTMLSD